MCRMPLAATLPPIPPSRVGAGNATNRRRYHQPPTADPGGGAGPAGAAVVPNSRPPAWPLGCRGARTTALN